LSKILLFGAAARRTEMARGETVGFIANIIQVPAGTVENPQSNNSTAPSGAWFVSTILPTVLPWATV
jgi:hypothetical protein